MHLGKQKVFLNLYIFNDSVSDNNESILLRFINDKNQENGLARAGFALLYEMKIRLKCH